MRKPIYAYEPVLVPRLDSDNNIIGYDNPIAIPCSLLESDSLRKKTHCNELGLSADPDNVTGFRRTIDVINQNRNAQGSGVVKTGLDDLDLMQQAETAARQFKSAKKK